MHSSARTNRCGGILEAQQGLSPHYDQCDKLFFRRQGGYVGVCTCVGAHTRVDMCVQEGRNRPQRNKRPQSTC